MNLADLTNRRVVRKKVDEAIAEIPATTVETPAPIIEDTATSVIVEDVIAQAQDLIDYTTSVVQDIVQTNQSDANFVEYAKLAKATYFDMGNLRNGEVYITPVNQVALKAAERDVYRRLVDPRAPFVADLHQIISEAGMSKYVLEEVWQGLMGKNELESEFKGDYLFNLALQHEKVALQAKKAHVQTVASNGPSKLAAGFFKGLVHNSTNKIDHRTNQHQIDSINQIIRTLRSVKAMLNLQLITQTMHWENFRAQVSSYMKDVLRAVGQRMMLAQKYAAASLLESKISEFTLDLEKQFGIDLTDAKELREFQNQVNQSLFQEVATIEDHHLVMLQEVVEQETARAHMVSNSQKVLRTKQYINSVDLLILEMETLKRTLEGMGDLLETEFEKSVASVQQSATIFVGRISTAPAKPLPELELLDSKSVQAVQAGYA